MVRVIVQHFQKALLTVKYPRLAFKAIMFQTTFNTSKFAAIQWRKERAGNYRLINFTSGSGLFGAPGQPNYAAAKLGIVGLTYSCANSLGPYGVTANAIAPGLFPSKMTAGLMDQMGEQIIAGTPLKRAGRPEDMAGVAIYLASKSASFVTGAIIPVDGGITGARASL